MAADASSTRVYELLLDGMWERLADHKQHAEVLQGQMTQMWQTIRAQEDMLKAHLVNERTMMESFEQLKQLHIVLVQQLNEVKAAMQPPSSPEPKEANGHGYRHRHVYNS